MRGNGARSEEYSIGGGGRKAKKLFTYAEWRREAVMAELQVLIPTAPPLTCHLQVPWMDRRGKASAEVRTAVCGRARACLVTSPNPHELFLRLSPPHSCLYARGGAVSAGWDWLNVCLRALKLSGKNSVCNLGIFSRSTNHLPAVHRWITIDGLQTPALNATKYL